MQTQPIFIFICGFYILFTDLQINSHTASVVIQYSRKKIELLHAHIPGHNRGRDALLFLFQLSHCKAVPISYSIQCRILCILLFHCFKMAPV
jgi:hypothetical protein